MIDPKDLAYCEEAIRHGSLSFHAASKVLPKKVRDPALALYAFCRLADDEVDLQADKAPAVLALGCLLFDVLLIGMAGGRLLAEARPWVAPT